MPKAMKSMGIKAQNLKVTDEAIRRIIEEYTAEAGVRGLKKQMDVLCRYAAVKLVKGEQKSITVSEKRVAEFLGHGIHHEKILENPVPGVVTGLAWTRRAASHRTAWRCDERVRPDCHYSCEVPLSGIRG